VASAGVGEVGFHVAVAIALAAIALAAIVTTALLR